MSTLKKCARQTFFSVLILFAFSSCTPIENHSHSKVFNPDSQHEASQELAVDDSSADKVDTAKLPEEIQEGKANEPESSPLTLAQPATDDLTAPAAEELTSPEPEETMAQEVKELEALGTWEEGTPIKMTEQGECVFDFPITLNRQVEFYLDFFQNKQKKTFTRWLERSGRYTPLVKKELKAAGLPTDLAYLPLIESGYSLTAYSRARAVGPWQFIRGTGRKYGLTINNYIDERRDPIKSTKAAVAYLSDLYNEFGSWPLSVAGYNAGEGKIRRAIKKYKTTNFWELAQGRYLKSETKRYVPKLMAAIIIAKEPEKYGFYDIDYQEPLSYETVKVPRWTTVKAVAVAINEDYEEMRNLNRELRRSITPPYSRNYTIKVPVGKKELVAENLKRVVPVMSTEYKTHVVKRGETLTKVCRKYNLNKTTILKANDLRSSKLAKGKRLRIPFRTTSYKLLAENQIATKLGPGIITSENLLLHKVKPGETTSEISKRYGVPPMMIAAWNDLDSVHHIRAGQQLALYLKDSVISKSPTPPEIAAMDKVASVTLNTKSKNSPKFESNSTDNDPESELTYYKVRGGDTLWDIAKRYNITTKEIKRWNSIRGSLIRPGLRLRLKIPKDVDA